MATRKNATKTTSRAKSGLADIQVSKKTKNTATKTLKNTSGKSFLVAFIFLLIGCLLGVGAWWFVCKDDTFELVGRDEQVLTLDEPYVDEGVRIIAFGQNELDSIEVETNLMIDDYGNFYAVEIGTFYIKYSSTCFKYGRLFKVEKVRLITYVEGSEGEV